MYIMNFNQATTKIQTLVVRSDSNPVDWTSQIQINEREYDTAHIQLLNVPMRLSATGIFPANETESMIIINVESNLGQSIYDSNGKQSFLGGFSYHRNGDDDAIDHGDSQVQQYANPISLSYLAYQMGSLIFN